MYKDKFKKVEYFEIEYYELDNIINQEYPDIKYESALEQPNDSYFTVFVDGLINWKDEFLLTNLLVNGHAQDYRTTTILMNDMCRKGLIEKGNYLINVSW